MKTINTFLLITLVLFATSFTSYARIGESPKQCNDRYGEVVFKYSDENLEYRSYNFQGRKIQVVFYKSESILEFIVSRSSAADAAKLTSENLSFFRGLLSSVYHFTDEQLKDLDISKIQPTATGGYRLSTESETLRASYSLDSNESQDSVKYSALVTKKGNEEIGDAISKFFVQMHVTRSKE